MSNKKDATLIWLYNGIIKINLIISPFIDKMKILGQWFKLAWNSTTGCATGLQVVSLSALLAEYTYTYRENSSFGTICYCKT